MTEPKFPHWWAKYDYYHPTDLEVEETVTMDGLTFVARGFDSKPPLYIRWDTVQTNALGYILDGSHKDGVPYRRFGWAVGFTPEGLRALPTYAGFWFAAGEARSLASASRDLARALASAEAKAARAPR